MKTLTAEEFDELAESGADISEYLDWDKATRGDSKRINLDLPIGFLAALDREAVRRGVTRQSLIKVWLYERLVPAGARLKTTSEIEAMPALPEMLIQGTSELTSATAIEGLSVRPRRKSVKKKVVR
jgi:hypothetical protein